MTDDGAVHLRWASNAIPADDVVLQVIPDPLIGVQLRGVRR